MDSMTVFIKRAYEPADAGDGRRILVDRLWPRGVSRDELAVDLWLKEIAPSTELRKWFGHDAAKWPEFQRRYRAELDGSAVFAELERIASGGTVTLVYAARDVKHNNAVVLQQLLAKA